MQDWGADGDLQDGGHAAGSGAEGEVGHLAAYRGTGLGHRGPGVPEGPQGQSLVERGPGDEPPGSVPGLHEPLVAQRLQRAAHGGPGHAVAGAQLGFGLQRPVNADVAQGDPLAQVMGDR